MNNIELSEVCYEQIKDNYHYGIFGDFKLVIDKTTGYFNATKLCVDGGKEFKKWSRLEKSKNILEYYQQSCCENSQDNFIYEVKGANKDKIERQITGTYVPKEFLPEIVSWMKFKKTDKRGVVYVITNSNLEPQRIYKIGYAQELNARLDTFNKYRKFEPCFHPKLVYEVENARELEGKVHLALKEYSQGYTPSKKYTSKNYQNGSTLKDVCYEHIKDNYHYGIFGDFKLVIDQKTGYFNATKLCKEGNKNFFEWKRLEKSRRLLEYYESCPGNSQGNLTYEVKGANKDKIEKQFTGTYVPKELILDIASWISIKFYDKCNNIIINYFVEEFKKMDNKNLKQKIKEVEQKMEKLTLENEEKSTKLVEKDDKIDELKQLILKQDRERAQDREYLRSLGISLEEVKDQNEELLDRNNGLKKDVKDVKRKLGVAVEDRAPQPKDESKRERFVLMKRNDPDYYPYYTIRAQDSYTTRKLKIERLHFPNLMVLLDFKCSPNSKTLYNRIKENLKAKGVVFKGNNIDLEDTIITEQDLMEEMKVINDSKRCVTI